MRESVFEICGREYKLIIKEPQPKRYITIGMHINPSVKRDRQILEILQEFAREERSSSISDLMKRLVEKFGELRRENAELRSLNEALRREVEELRRKCAELEKRLAEEFSRKSQSAQHHGQVICTTLTSLVYRVSVCADRTVLTVLETLLNEMTLTRKEIEKVLSRLQKLGIVQNFEIG